MAGWDKMVASLSRAARRRPTGWYKRLGRPLSASEVEAYLGIVKPCPGAVASPERDGGKLRGWWEVAPGQFSERPYLDAVWQLALNRARKRARKGENT
jgi:hypothetical protein